MRVVSALAAAWWAFMFIGYLCGFYTPDNADIGVSLLIGVIYFTISAIDRK